LLFFITDLELGGTPTVVKELAARLSPFASIEVASLKPAGPIGDELVSKGIKVHSLDITRVTELRSAVRGLFELITSGKFDTVFSFLVHANFVASRVCPSVPTVRCLQSIQTTQPRPRWHWWLQSRIHGAAARIVVPSESVANRAVERSGVPREKIVVIPNAVDAERYDIAKVPAADSLFRIGFVGRLDPVKCVPDLVSALITLPANVRLDIFGDGSMRHAIAALVTRLGLGDRVTLHGATRDPREAYSQMDVLVLPSSAEGFGLVLIEAMASRVPVIGTDVDGIRDVVSNGQNGLLVPCGDPGAIANAVSRIMNEPGLRNMLIAKAKHEVEHRFAWPPVIEQYRKVLALD
jgi:glycosyltransferase involved in cell wall biosynthesis